MAQVVTAGGRGCGQCQRIRQQLLTRNCGIWRLLAQVVVVVQVVQMVQPRQVVQMVQRRVVLVLVLITEAGPRSGAGIGVGCRCSRSSRRGNRVEI